MCPSRGTEFFPPRTFASGDYDGADSRKEMSGFFALMSEPSLWCGDAADESYRLLEFSPFGPPRPIAIRVTRVGSQTDLTAVTLRGGKHTGVNLFVERRMQKRLKDHDWAAFVKAVEQAGFWAAPNVPPRPPLVLDGDALVLEGRRGHFYRVLPGPQHRPSSTTMLSIFFTMAGLEQP